MRVKITKCSNHYFWYNDKIGDIYQVRELFNYNGYKTYTVIGSSDRAIKEGDCEVLENYRNKLIDQIINV